jgi:hypothetical protein
MRPLQNVPFCPISASDSNFIPQNTQCIPVVKMFVFPRSKSGIFDLNLNKIEHFSKVSSFIGAKKRYANLTRISHEPDKFFMSNAG